MPRPAPQPRCTLERFVHATYLPHARARKRSWQVDERILRQHVLPELGSLRPGSIAPARLESWFQQRRASGLSPATCNRILAVLKAVFALAVSLKVISGPAPIQAIRFLPVAPRPERFLSREEIGRLVGALSRQPRAEARAALLLLYTGARKSEILRARWEDVDLERGLLTVPISKSGRCRRIVLSAQARRLIATLPSLGQSPWLFPGSSGERPLADIYRFWHQLRTSLGLSGLRVHDLRHTFASLVVNAGHSLYQAQLLLGHLSPGSTLRYAHLDQGQLMRIADGICHEISIAQPGAGRMPGLRRRRIIHAPARQRATSRARILAGAPARQPGAACSPAFRKAAPPLPPPRCQHKSHMKQAIPECAMHAGAADRHDIGNGG